MMGLCEGSGTGGERRAEEETLCWLDIQDGVSL